MAVRPVELGEPGAEVLGDLLEHAGQVADHLPGEYITPVPRHEDQMNMQGGNYMSASPVIVAAGHRPTCYSGAVLARYRYRACPEPGQETMLARTFGCARETARPVGEAEGPEGRSSAVPVPEGSPAVDPAHPQRARRTRRQAPRRQGRGSQGPVVAAAATRAVRRHGDPRGRRTLLRLVRGRGESHALPVIGHDVGLDLGLSMLAAASGGELIANPRHLRAREGRMGGTIRIPGVQAGEHVKG